MVMLLIFNSLHACIVHCGYAQMHWYHFVLFYSNVTAVESQVISSQISSESISLPPDGYINLTFILDKVML